MGNRIYRRELINIDELIASVVVDWKDVRRMSLRYNDKYRTFMASVPVGTPNAQAIEWVNSHRDWMLETKREKEGVERLHDTVDDDCYAYFITRRLPAIVKRCEQLTGLNASDYIIKVMSSRWGSANLRTRAITLNSNLAAYSDDCVAYVVIHELMHFIEPSHSERFWSLVARYCPDWQRHRATLRH